MGACLEASAMKSLREISWVRFVLARLELRVLALIVAAGVALMSFLHISDEVGEGDTDAIDRQILLAFRNPADPSDPIGSRGVEEAVRDITALGGVTCLTFFVVIAAACLIFFRRRREALVFVVAAVL